MKEFTIRISSLQQVLDFVTLATTQPFRILVSSGPQLVNAKSIMGMVSLDFSQPVSVRCDCSSETLDPFLCKTQELLNN